MKPGKPRRAVFSCMFCGGAACVSAGGVPHCRACKHLAILVRARPRRLQFWPPRRPSALQVRAALALVPRVERDKTPSADGPDAGTEGR